MVDVPRQQREQHEHDAIERGPFPRVEHINARPQAPVVVFEFHVVHDASSLRGRRDPVAIRRHDGPAVEPAAQTHYSISRRAARSVVKKSVASTTSAPRQRQRARVAERGAGAKAVLA